MKTKDEDQEWLDSLELRYDFETPEHRHHRQTWLGMVMLTLSALLMFWLVKSLVMWAWSRNWTWQVRGGDMLAFWICACIVVIVVAILGTRRPK